MSPGLPRRRYSAHGAVPFQTKGAKNEIQVEPAGCRSCRIHAARSWRRPRTPNVDQRQANQQQRIDQGVASGQLTGKEAAQTGERPGSSVEKKEDKAKADGKVTAEGAREV
jgi:hypothetical protein